MAWFELGSSKSSCSADAFCNSVKIWIERPNICSKVVSCAKIEEIKSKESLIWNKCSDLPKSTEHFCINVVSAPFTCSYCNKSFQDNNFKDAKVVLRKLVPRNCEIHHAGHELIITTEEAAFFFPLQPDSLSNSPEQTTYMFNNHSCMLESESSITDEHYRITLFVFNKSQKENESQLNQFSTKLPKRSCHATQQWLTEKLFPLICKWSNEENTKLPKNSKKFPTSLSLIDKEKYSILYQELKRKYGLELAKVWPEVTDPQKYVYEDVAIATYLLVLWEQERELLGTSKLQSFVDIGCGNGLLVHILNSEKHPGKGIDIRKRKVWEVLSKANLEEDVVTPEDLSPLQGYDWLLGNHSDELTPWIPVMASRCSYNTRYWVLPCCFFDFNCKFERSQSTNGQYRDYLNFVSSVGSECGFQVMEDVMRIPSTKRVCYVGMKKNYPENEHSLKLLSIERFVTSRCDETKYENLNFVPRPKMEKIQNCTKMKRTVQQQIVDIIVKKLLSVVNMKENIETGKSWNMGGSLPLHEAAALLDEKTRNEMKNECGGLQTLMRNYHQIFEIRNGNVQLRDWSLTQTRRKRKRNHLANSAIKTKQCWFYINHPDGCPLSNAKCNFLHGNE
ncbi:putative tRNA (uracil-O(2)-)-methyltransferase isoform X2 [Ciona intestinalis]